MSKNYPVSGGKQIVATLTALGKRLENQAVRSGLTAAAGVVRDEARIRAPKQSGKMAKAIKSGSPRKNQDGSYSITVRLDPRGNNHAFLGYFFEYGVRAHYITPGDSGLSARKTTIAARREGSSDTATGALKIGDTFVSGAVLHPGFAAHPFLRPALDARADDAIAAFTTKIVAVVEGKTGFNLTAGMDEAA